MIELLLQKLKELMTLLIPPAAPYSLKLIRKAVLATPSPRVAEAEGRLPKLLAWEAEGRT